MLDRVVAIISKYTEVQDITVDSVIMSDLELTSFDLVEIVAEFEDEFDMEVPDRVLASFVTVGDIVNYLEENAE